jgi:hypothetical protein
VGDGAIERGDGFFVLAGRVEGDTQIAEILRVAGVALHRAGDQGHGLIGLSLGKAYQAEKMIGGGLGCIQLQHLLI